MAKIAYSTQIEYETLILLNKYLEENPGNSKASVTNEAIKEYILTREKEKGGK